MQKIHHCRLKHAAGVGKQLCCRYWPSTVPNLTQKTPYPFVLFLLLHPMMAAMTEATLVQLKYDP